MSTPTSFQPGNLQSQGGTKPGETSADGNQNMPAVWSGQTAGTSTTTTDAPRTTSKYQPQYTEEQERMILDRNRAYLENERIRAANPTPPSMPEGLRLPMNPMSIAALLLADSTTSGGKRKRAIEDHDATRRTRSASVAEPQVILSRSPKQSDMKKQQHEINKMRERRLATLPEYIKPELVGFDSGDASTKAKREYFEGLRRTDLLNLLSFCGQIKPGLLVDILVSVVREHPDLPIFNAPDWAQPKVDHTSHQTNILQNTTANRRGPPKVSKQRSKTGGVRKILKTAPAEPNAAAEDEEGDSLPPTWSKPGKGLYASLPPENEDPLLVDDNDEEAFSHFLVDNNGKQVIEPAPQPVTI